MRPASDRAGLPLRAADRHENTTQVVNTLYDASGVVRSDTWERLAGSYHGSGCTLARPSRLDWRMDWRSKKPPSRRRNTLWQTLAAGFRPGMGQFIPDRFFWARPAESDE